MSYRVSVQNSGHQFAVAAGETVLDAALRQGLALPYSCRGGQCGSCKARLVSGGVDYGTSWPEALSREEAAGGAALLCCAHPTSDLVIDVREVEAVADIPVRTLPCRVARMERLSHDVMRLFLKLPKTERLQYLAGQYLDILLRDGRRRSFSIANPPHDDEFLELHIRHVEGGRFTAEVFSKMKEKDLLRVEAPLGSFFLREDSNRPVILMAGGTGFAPIKAIVEHALAESISRPMYLYWGVRTRADLYLPDLPREWARRCAQLSFVPVLSEPLAEDGWKGRIGWVHEAILEDFADLSEFEVYACGPPPMIEAAGVGFAARGLNLEHFYYDSFEFARD
ncbi:MAG: CDP-6-deoxy-delta-3,4-glucoseen reductase [Gammaproteobacteria bacterium SG8_47]|nr:MAG: CDP-6-deoxy-delta-3,4-glucoseen reductase [Gammaproteobacteria bacterium SG8_47]